MSKPVRVVLVVEDDVDSRELLTMFLTSEGYTVLQAADGREALARLRDTPDVCVILLDLMMPGMNGWEFRAAQRADTRLVAIPTVIVSAVANVKDKARDLDAAGYIPKPLDPDRLIHVVRTHCS